MSSSTFIQRWTSVNDLTTIHNSNHNQQSKPFFLRPQSVLAPFSSSSSSELRPSQSLISLVESPSKVPCQTTKNVSISSRVATIIEQFESQTRSIMNNSTKVSSPIHSIFVKQWEDINKNCRSQRSTPIVLLETSSPVQFNTKNKKAQPIIICEKITNQNKSNQSVINSNTRLINTWSQLKLISQQQQQNISNDNHSILNRTDTQMNNNESILLSRFTTTTNTIDSTSSSLPRFARPTMASVQKQRRFVSNSNGFKRTNSPPSISTFTRLVPLIPSSIPPVSSINQDLQQQTKFSTSKINLIEHLSTIDRKRYLPLKYKRDSFLRLYGSDIMQQHGHHLPNDVVLEDDVDPPFSPRIVTVKKNKSVTNEYDLMEILGRGKFGEVKKCREKSSQHLLAAKFIQINKEQDRIEALNEIEIMKALQHPRLLQLYDAFETKTNICLIMELISGGELFERVIDDGFILTERLCELYMMQICEGVHFMHLCNIIHLDMKPENILCVNRNGHRIKIIDFGLARKFDPTKQLKVLFGTPEFVAPEVINFDRVGYGTDMWSVGVICYVLLSGLSPFMGENDNDTYANINRVNYDFDDEAFTDISDEAKDFISKLLLKDKDKRLSAKQCLAHPWLTRRPKLVSKPSEEDTAGKQLSTKKLRRFVIRRRWQKAVNALLALQRMGMTL